MVYSTRRFVVCLSVCHFVLVFFSPFSIAITSLEEERANLSYDFWYVCLVCACLDLSFSSSSWGLGRAAVCDCGTPWTFLLPFVLNKFKSKNFKASKLSTYDFSTLCTTLPHHLTKDKPIDLINRTFIRENTQYLACNEEYAFFHF